VSVKNQISSKTVEIHLTLEAMRFINDKCNQFRTDFNQKPLLYFYVDEINSLVVIGFFDLSMFEHDAYTNYDSIYFYNNSILSIQKLIEFKYIDCVDCALILRGFPTQSALISIKIF
jgi:hypothetical protein